LKVLVTFAVEAELAPWKRRLELRAADRNDIAMHSTTLLGVELDFAVTGIGPANASRLATGLLNKPYDLCIASGFAGALRSGHAVGQIVTPRNVRHFESPRTIECDTEFTSLAVSKGAEEIDTLLSLNQVASTLDEKAQLAPFADACDMESFAVLSAAAARSVPAIAIRAISDSSDDSVPAGINDLVNSAGHVKVGGVVRFMAGHPFQLLAVARLALHTKAAARSLARFLESYVTSLALSSRLSVGEELQGVGSR
jgi:nucleoside phosphorylase